MTISPRAQELIDYLIECYGMTPKAAYDWCAGIFTGWPGEDYRPNWLGDYNATSNDTARPAGD